VIDFRVLGPLEARRAGRSIPLGGPKQRALLAYLLLRANTPVSTDELVDALWPLHNADNARQALRVAVSRLRAALGASTLATRAAGYELLVPDEQVDLHRFRSLTDEADRAFAAEEWTMAVSGYGEALRLWRGPALADVRNDGLGSDADRLEELRLNATEPRIEAELELGRHAALVGELDELVERHPYRERLRRLHMLALYRSGRQAEALESYRRARRRFVDELGIEPGPELQGLERAILRQDAELAPHRVEPATPPVDGSRAPARRKIVAGVGAVTLIAVAAGATFGLVRGGPSDAGAELVHAKANSLVILDEESGRATGDIALGGSATDLAVGKGSVWVLLGSSGVVLRVDPARRTRKAIGVPPDPIGITTGAGGVWVADGWNTITRIDPSTGQADRPIELARDRVFPNVIADLVATRDAVWLASRDTAEAARYSVRSGRLQNHLGLGGGEGEFFYGAGTSVIGHGLGDIWLTNRVEMASELPTSGRHNGRATRMEADTGRVLHRYPFASVPTAIAATGDAVWIAVADRIWRIERDDAFPTHDVRVPAAPVAIAADESGAWVVTSDRRLLQIDSGGTEIVRHWRLDEPPTAVGVGFGQVWVAVGPRD